MSITIGIIGGSGLYDMAEMDEGRADVTTHSGTVRRT